MMKTQVAVLGGGASGMMAAIVAARAGAQVCILEQNDRPGKKILATGNGKCNFTNRIQQPECYRSNDTTFPGKVLARFDVTRTLQFFESIGIVPKEKNGYIYPASGQASAVRELLSLELERLGVRLCCPVRVETCLVKDGRFCLKGFRKQMERETGPAKKKKCRETVQVPFLMQADRLILACGGQAAPSSGSDGSGFVLARKLGHPVTPLCPALVQLRCRERFYPQLAGVRTEAEVKLYVDGQAAASDRGELQLTAYGISGIPVFQVSRFAGMALAAGKQVEAELDLVPFMTETDLEQYFASCSVECYGGLLPGKLLPVLLKRYGRDPQKLAAGVKRFRTGVAGTNSFEQAQVTAGGVDTRWIDPDTMMSRNIPGLYFAGEIVDVDGICGGYNLQWAWSSGFVAGISAAGNGAVSAAGCNQITK